MPIEATTVYTQERLLRFQNHLARLRKVTWILSAVVTLLLLILSILSIVLIGNFTLLIYLFFMLFLDAFYVFCFVIYPRITIKKSNALNAKVHFAFEEETLHAEATTESSSESSTLKYTSLVKICKKENELYLFIAPQRAFIVDLSDFSEEQICTLKSVLQTKIKPKKFKWA